MIRHKLKELISSVPEDLIVMLDDFRELTKSYEDTLKAENRLAEVSNWRFVRCFSRTAKALAESTRYTYLDYLEQARELFLEGKDEQEVLWHFDRILYGIERR